MPRTARRATADRAPYVPQDRYVQEGLRAQMAVNPKKLRPYDEPPPARRPLIPDAPDSAATGYLVLSFVWLAVTAGIGLLWVAMQVFPDLLTFAIDLQLPLIGTLSIELSPISVQTGFTAAAIFGWISNAAFAAILFITPRILGERLRLEPIAWLGIGAWNVGVAAGLAVVYLPNISQAGLASVFPLPIDGLLLLGLLAVNGAFWLTLLGARRLPYVSAWFFGVGLLAFLGLYTIASGLPLLGLDDTATALLNAFTERGIETYWVLGIALGTLFYVVPRVTVNPLASGGMGMLAWLLWAGAAGLSAIGALVDPSVPYLITALGNVGTILLVAPAFLAVAVLAMTMSGRWTLVLAPGTAAFALVALAFVIGASLLDAIGALRSVQDLVRNTEWRLGAWTWLTLGAATFAAFALADHAAPRMMRRNWPESPLAAAQLWSAFLGAALTGLALVGAGIVHGSLIADGAPPEEVSATLAWFLVVAAGGIGLLGLAAIAGLVTLFLIYTSGRPAEYVVVEAPPATAGTGVDRNAAPATATGR